MADRGEAGGAQERDAQERTRRRASAVALALLALLAGCGEGPGSAEPGIPSSSSEVEADPEEWPKRRFEWVAAGRSEVLGAAGIPISHGPFVVFDQSKQTLSSPYDTRFAGLSRWADEIEASGARVSLNHQSLDRFLPGYCGPGRVLVLGIPWRDRYTDKERAALEACLEVGGGVLVLAEHDDVYGHAKIQNELTQAYGIRVLPSSALARTRRRGGLDETAPERPDRMTGSRGSGFASEWVLAKSELLEVGAVRLYLAAPLELRAPAVPLLELRRPADPARRIVGALVQRGAGRLVVLGDLEMFWNMTPDGGLRAEQNRDFARRLLDLLAGRKSFATPGMHADSDAEAAATGDLASEREVASTAIAAAPIEPRVPLATVLFESSGGSLVPDARPNGLTQLALFLSELGYAIEIGQLADHTPERFDLVVVAVPRRALRESERFQRADRLLLIADGQQDLLLAEPGLSSWLPLRFEFEAAYPLDPLARDSGFSFAPVTLLSLRDRFFVEARWERSESELAEVPLRLARATMVLPRGDFPPFQVLASAAASARPVLVLSPVQSAAGEAELDLTAAPDRSSLLRVTGTNSSWPVVVASKRIFAAADLELLTDSELGAEGGAGIRRALRRWLQIRPALDEHSQ